jgi:protein phosphatase
MVADGMGGAAAGEIASGIFAETTREVFDNSDKGPEPGTAELVQTVFQTANERILNHILENPSHKGMGCTAELMAFSDKEMVLGHIGDSRTYRFRNGNLRQITRDHSLVQEQIEQGQITAREARKHPLRNVILRAVGISEGIALDIVKVRPQANDIFLLCSDGLTDMIGDEQIRDVLASDSRLGEKIDTLIELAKAAGGSDNITVVLCKIS